MKRFTSYCPSFSETLAQTTLFWSPGQRQVASLCWYSNDNSGSIKRGEFLDQLRTCYLLSKDSASWSLGVKLSWNWNHTLRQVQWVLCLGRKYCLAQCRWRWRNILITSAPCFNSWCTTKGIEYNVQYLHKSTKQRPFLFDKHFVFYGKRLLTVVFTCAPNCP